MCFDSSVILRSFRFLFAAVTLLLLGALWLWVWVGPMPPPEALRGVVAPLHPGVAWVRPAALRAQLRSGAALPKRAPQLWDARSEAEFAVSHLPGALWVPSLEAARRTAGDEPGAVVVYCSVGWRSAALAERLMRAGYPNVRNLEGGIFAWARRGYPLATAGEGGEGPARTVHPYGVFWGRFLPAGLRAPLTQPAR